MKRPPGFPFVPFLAAWLVLFALLGKASAGLVLWYPFNEGGGAVVNDAGGNGSHLAANAGGFLWNQKAGAPFGGSIHFNGTGSALAQKNAVSVQPQTIDSLRSRSGNKVTIAF